MAVEGDVLLAVTKLLAGGDAQLLAHQVNPADHFSHRVFDLQAGVHFDEGELPILPQKFQRAGIAIAQFTQATGDIGAEFVTLRPAERRAAGLLHQLLVAALQRAVTLTKMHDIAMGVGHNLQFDMARAVEVFFQIDLVIAESGLGLGAGNTPGFFKLILGMRHLHAAPATAGSGLDDDRILDLGRD